MDVCVGGCGDNDEENTNLISVPFDRPRNLRGGRSDEEKELKQYLMFT